VATANERFFEKVPREGSDGKCEAESKQGDGEATKFVELRLSVQEKVVGNVIEGVMEDVDAIGNNTESAEPAPAHDGGEAGASLRKDDEQEATVENGKPTDADGETDDSGRTSEPPEKGGDSEQKKKQSAAEERCVIVEENTESRLAPSNGEKNTPCKSVRAAGHGERGDPRVGGPTKDGKAKGRCEANDGHKERNECALRNEADEKRGEEIELLFDGERPSDDEPDPGPRGHANPNVLQE